MPYIGLIDGVGASNLQTQITALQSTKADTTNQGIAKAFVCFDGRQDTTGATSTSNTNRKILSSFGVASVLRNGAGDYTITFSPAMADTDYGVIANCTMYDAGSSNYGIGVNCIADGTPVLKTTTQVKVLSQSSAGTNEDRLITVSIYR